MAWRVSSIRDWRKTRLIGPIAALTIGTFVLLTMVVLFLTERFDTTAYASEHQMVERGFTRLISEHDSVVATQVQWDEAVRSLDHKQALDWADFNIGNYLFTFHGFTRSFVVDGAGKAFYASIDGERADPATFAPFASVSAQLLPTIRQAERSRPALKPRPGKNNIAVKPIQRNTFARVGDKVYIVTATLVQPDFGRVLPLGDKAPVTITALPVDAALLRSFSARYLLDGLVLARSDRLAADSGQLALRGTDGATVATLAWTPKRPGTELYRSLWLPLLCVLVMLCLAGWKIIRRTDSIVTELVASESRAKHLALHDPLTCLPNRALLFERLEAMLTGAGDGTLPVAVLCVDLDRFKEINDTQGHQAGDLVIETLAARLRVVCGDAALISRLGGDEFVVLLAKADRDQAQRLGQAIIAEAGKPIQSEYGRIETACSIGVAIITRGDVEPSEALRWADLALYRSKETGRGRLTFFKPEMDQALRNRRALESDLRQAMTDGSLRMEYQPQVDLTGQIIAAEALLRWQHPVRGDIPPGVFVPLAEETGLILSLGEFVLRQVFADTGRWDGTRVAINVSAEQMRAPGFAAMVTRIAAQAGIDPRRYEIELAETALLDNQGMTETNINALKRLGFTIALDDFGTGYSSLSVLQRFGVDRIKIDRSFVKALGADGETEALIDAMVKLARALNLKVTAEGVESVEQCDRLAACGCTEFQGYLIGRPMAPTAIWGLLGGTLAAPGRVRRSA